MKIGDKNMSSNAFAVSIASLFIASFIAFNWYVRYEVSGSKAAKYLANNEIRTKRVDARIADSYAGISERNFARQAFDNYAFESFEVDANLLEEDLNVLNKGTLADFQPTVAGASHEVLIPSRGNLQVNNVSFMEPRPFVNSSIVETGNVEYALANDLNLKKFNYYVGLGFQPAFGVSNYYNRNFAQEFTSETFTTHINSELVSENKSLVWGVGGNVYAGVQFKNGISLEMGVAYNEMSGTARYAVEHIYEKEIQRLEWIVSGEDDVQAFYSSDFVQETDMDTISTVVSRSVLSVPLHLNYSLDLGKVSPFVSIGSSLNFTSNGEQNMHSTFQKKNVLIAESKGLSQINLSVGAGVDVALTSTISARIKPAYEFGLWSNNPTYFEGHLDNLNLHTGLLYRF